MNPYYELYVYFLGPKILTEIETLKAKLERGAEAGDVEVGGGAQHHLVIHLSHGGAHHDVLGELVHLVLSSSPHPSLHSANHISGKSGLQLFIASGVSK